MYSYLFCVLKFGLLVTESFIFLVVMTSSNRNFEVVCGVLKSVIQGFIQGRVFLFQDSDKL